MVSKQRKTYQIFRKSSELMVDGGLQSAWVKHNIHLRVCTLHYVSICCLFLLLSLTKLNGALALLKTILGTWSGSVWLLLLYAVWSILSSVIPASKPFLLWFYQNMDAVSTWSSWNVLRLKAVTFCLFVVLGPRATSGCSSAQDARFGGSADHAVGELPRVLHPRHALHHGRVSHCTGLLRAGWHELGWHLVWWGSRQVSGLSLCVSKALAIWETTQMMLLCRVFWLVFVTSSWQRLLFCFWLEWRRGAVDVFWLFLHCVFQTYVGFSSCPAHLSSGITSQWAAGDQVSFVKAMSEEV